MNKIFLILLLSINLFADTLTFKGSFHTDERKVKADGRMGFPGGCIYSGLSNGGRKIKVYTKDNCPVINGLAIGSPDKKLKKIRYNGEFSCEVSEGALFEIYVMYEGECKVK